MLLVLQTGQSLSFHAIMVHPQNRPETPKTHLLAHGLLRGEEAGEAGGGAQGDGRGDEEVVGRPVCISWLCMRV